MKKRIDDQIAWLTPESRQAEFSHLNKPAMKMCAPLILIYAQLSQKDHTGEWKAYHSI